jgi:hypothetical protein
VGTISNFSYDQRKVRELCSHMNLYHDYPFMLVEHVLFNKFMKACVPIRKELLGLLQGKIVLPLMTMISKN